MNRVYSNDETKYYKCPKCSSINELYRNKGFLDGYSSYSVSVIENNPLETGNTNIYGIEDLVLPKLNQDGTPNNFVRPTLYTKNTDGCWLCGYKNI